MKGDTEFIEPFYIPSSTPGTGARAVIKPQTEIHGELDLVVVSGGPVFLIKGKHSVSYMYTRTHPPVPADGEQPQIDFDLAACLGMVATMRHEPDMGIFTLSSDSESVGYIRFRPCP